MSEIIAMFVLFGIIVVVVLLIDSFLGDEDARKPSNKTSRYD